MVVFRNLRRTDYIFLFYLTALVAAFAVYFLSFTLFNGFSTFANDAGSYVLLAQKWSLFHQPTDVAVHTWPVQDFPPGFPLILAITGASNSLWAGHLLVSICMLASIFLLGWMSYRRLGWLIAGLLTPALCLLPGVVISSMGILSENLYLFLSLAVLLLYPFIKKKENASWAWYLLCLSLLTLVILTRTIGIALIAAVFLVTLFDRELSGRQKSVFYIVIFSSMALWFLWGVINPQSSDLTYGYYFKGYVGDDLVLYIWSTVKINFIQILSSWSHYISLTYANIWLFLLSYSLFLICFIGLGLRLFERKLDAVYLLFYVAILLVWPHPDQMMRFLHPIMFLLILQPVFYFAGNSGKHYHFSTKPVLIMMILALTGSSLFIQIRMLEQRRTVINTNPGLKHSYGIYHSPSIAFSRVKATIFTDVMRYMTMSAQHVPFHGVVATVKHDSYSILAQRRAVNLIAVVPYMQQLCNIKIKDVDVVFLSALTTEFNQEGFKQLEMYKNISSDVFVLDGGVSDTVAYSLIIDKVKLASELFKGGYNCRYYQSI